MDKVKIGFVGAGGMGQRTHLKNYATLPECEVVAIAEIKEKQGKAVAAKYGVPKVYTDYKEMLAKEKLDGIVAAQHFRVHGVLVPELYKAGIPVFTEKPLSGSVEWGEKILAALASSGTWHMVGYHKRSDPATMWAKAEIDRLKQTGELGALKYVRLLMPAGDWIASDYNDLIIIDEPAPPPQFETPPSDMDTSTTKLYTSFVNNYIHQVNLMRYLLGESYKVTYADPSQVLLAVQSESGVAGIIEMTSYQTTIDWQETAVVCFEHGYIKIDLPAPLESNRPGKVEAMRDPGNGVVPTTCSPTLPWVHAMRQQASNFISAIKGESTPPCQATEALEDLKVAREYIRLLKGV
jgi:predicted dehydrogenase